MACVRCAITPSITLSKKIIKISLSLLLCKVTSVKNSTEERGIDTSQIDSMILIIPGEAYYVKSSAALQIFKRLKGAVSLSRIFLPLPESFRDSIYDLIARNRYRWFGKKETWQNAHS